MERVVLFLLLFLQALTDDFQYLYRQFRTFHAAREHQRSHQGRHDHQAALRLIFTFQSRFHLGKSGIEHCIGGGAGLAALAEFRAHGW